MFCVEFVLLCLWRAIFLQFRIQGVLDRTIADGEAEQQIYDKYACWCETTAKCKANAITEAQFEMRRLGQQILSLKGKIATPTSEIEGLTADIAQNETDQALATSLREKDNSDYEADSVERKQAIAAIARIKPGKETFFLQTSSESSAPVRHAYAVLKKQATKAHSLRLARLAASVRMAKSGHFDKVIASIDKIIQNLKDEEAADIAKRDECKDQYLSIESIVKDLSWKIKKNGHCIH